MRRKRPYRRRPSCMTILIGTVKKFHERKALTRKIGPVERNVDED